MAKIVVLDAEPLVRSVVTKILSRAGHEVREASDLSIALQVLSASPANLIITNVYLPGITGHDALKALKKQCPQTPVLMVSGLPDNEVIENWKKEQGWDVFPKPFSPAELVSKVDEVLKTGKVNSAAGS